MNERGCQCPKWYDAFAMQMPWIANLCFFHHISLPLPLSLSLFVHIIYASKLLFSMVFVFATLRSDIWYAVNESWYLIIWMASVFVSFAFQLAPYVTTYKLYSINTSIYFYRAVSFHLSEIVILMLVPSHFYFFFQIKTKHNEWIIWLKVAQQCLTTIVETFKNRAWLNIKRLVSPNICDT